MCVILTAMERRRFRRRDLLRRGFSPQQQRLAVSFLLLAILGLIVWSAIIR
jgi:hypothetical protein